jgi:hypothetical protein
VDETLEHVVHRELRGHGQNRVTHRLKGGAETLRHAAHDSFGRVPRLWFWTQAAIVAFVLAGIVIAITKLV